MTVDILERYADYETQPKPSWYDHMDTGLMSATILVTEECNLRCSYCYIAKENLFMSEETARQSVDFLFDHAKPEEESLNITFFGGEPLVNPKLIAYICDYANARAKREGRKITYSMTSNGTLMTQKNYELVTKYGICVQLSLDGVKDSHDFYRKTIAGKGSFELIERNLERLLKLNCRVRLTVAPDTAESLADSVDWILAAGFRQVAISPVIEADWTQAALQHLMTSWKKLYALEKKHKTEDRQHPIGNLSGFREKLEDVNLRKAGCGAARGMVAINAKGSIFPCHRYIGYFRGTDDVAIGHVASGFNALRRAFYLESNFMANKSGCGTGVFAEDVPNEEKSCKSCAMAQNCGTACMAVNHFMNKDPRMPSPINRVLSQIQISAEYSCGHG